MSENREVTLDFVAIVIVGLVLAVLLVVSLGVNLWALSARQDEHEVLHRHVDRLERKVETMIAAERAEREAIEQNRP